MSSSVAMTSDLESQLANHLLRDDGQEDVCFATYATSTGRNRSTCLLREVVMPHRGDRSVHGNASVRSEYLIRVADLAAASGLGVALLHSHPGARGWQGVSRQDFETEADLSRVAEAITGMPLVGVTVAGGDRTWSARRWLDAKPQHCESVRVVGAHLRVNWNEQLRRVPRTNRSQSRSIAAWSQETHSDIARLKVLVVGVGSVGLEIAQRLAATGIERVTVMDPDSIGFENLDRMLGATRRDARRKLKKVRVARRLMRQASTAADRKFEALDMRVDSETGLGHALDCDVIFSCVDRPLPRAVLNSIAYSDLIPVIDGGIAIDTLGDGRMRGATWRSHVLVPGRPCMVCNGQIGAMEISRELAGILDNPRYIKDGPVGDENIAPNVALLAAAVIGSQLAQFVSLVVAPSGLGAPSPQQFALPGHSEIPLEASSDPHCAYENRIAWGDHRLPYVEVHAARGSSNKRVRPWRTGLQRLTRPRVVPGSKKN